MNICYFVRTHVYFELLLQRSPLFKDNAACFLIWTILTQLCASGLLFQSCFFSIFNHSLLKCICINPPSCPGMRQSQTLSKELKNAFRCGHISIHLWKLRRQTHIDETKWSNSISSTNNVVVKILWKTCVFFLWSTCYRLWFNIFAILKIDTSSHLLNSMNYAFSVLYIPFS